MGCGAVGLATARLLQRRGKDVTIYARDLPPNTTSDVAGAQWSPFSVYDEDTAPPGFGSRFRRACRLAHREFQNLVGARYGVRWIENYFVGEEPFRPPGFLADLPDLYPDVAELGPDDHPFGTRHAVRVTTMFVEPNVYLRRVLDDFLLAGGRIVVREFREPAELAGLPERAVMNCTGLGAKALFGDDELVPVKGQLTVLLPQPEVDYCVLRPGLYMFPRSDGILLGGTWEEGEWSLEPNREAERRVVEGHMRLFGARGEGEGAGGPGLGGPASDGGAAPGGERAAPGGERAAPGGERAAPGGRTLSDPSGAAGR